MEKATRFQNSDGTFSKSCEEYFAMIKDYANQYNLRNTLIALELSADLHNGMFRDGGSPYIIHPLEVTRYLILLNVRNAIFSMNKSHLHDDNLAETQTNFDIDVLLASSLLHDTVEDCSEKLPDKNFPFVSIYKMHPDVNKYVNILTKDKNAPGFSTESYYNKIAMYWQTLIIKVADRTSNCSTIDAFNEKRMEKYVKETKQYVYRLTSLGKNRFPDFSRILTSMKYLIVSICETVASYLNISGIIGDSDYGKTFNFIKGFSIGKGSMQNTLKSLPLANEYYDGLKRKSGDPLIIHPLRVCSYLISLKIDDDIICSAALLHEVINKCHLDYNGAELLSEHHLDPLVLDYIRLLSNSEHYPLDIYYKSLQQYPEVLVLKLSNRANTCTTLYNSSDEEVLSYIEECETYIYPLCKYAIEHYPQYRYSVEVMYYHISSICKIVKKLRSK